MATTAVAMSASASDAARSQFNSNAQAVMTASPSLTVPPAPSMTIAIGVPILKAGGARAVTRPSGSTRKPPKKERIRLDMTSEMKPCVRCGSRERYHGNCVGCGLDTPDMEIHPAYLAAHNQHPSTVEVERLRSIEKAANALLKHKGMTCDCGIDEDQFDALRDAVTPTPERCQLGCEETGGKVLLHRAGCNDDRGEGVCSLCGAIERPCPIHHPAEESSKEPTPLPQTVGPDLSAPSQDKCPDCGAPEVEALSPRTVYACGSSDYDQRPGTFTKGPRCNGKVAA